MPITLIIKYIVSIKTNKHIDFKKSTVWYLWLLCIHTCTCSCHEHMYICFCIYMHTCKHTHSIYIHHIVNMAQALVSVGVCGTNISTLVGILRIHAKYKWNCM